MRVTNIPGINTKLMVIDWKMMTSLLHEKGVVESPFSDNKSKDMDARKI